MMVSEMPSSIIIRSQEITEVDDDGESQQQHQSGDLTGDKQQRLVCKKKKFATRSSPLKIHLQLVDKDVGKQNARENDDQRNTLLNKTSESRMSIENEEADQVEI